MEHSVSVDDCRCLLISVQSQLKDIANEREARNGGKRSPALVKWKPLLLYIDVSANS
jgi:hypothetical protein